VGGSSRQPDLDFPGSNGNFEPRRELRRSILHQPRTDLDLLLD
ncbi:uncharacterized protein PgNI_09760, partial [Pyricularia grisea]|uniref:Uncharacterized protein n=1 Tax=Pyricularia grisea TaxID=148305 RepID=A0A6P8AT16_PYRGI